MRFFGSRSKSIPAVISRRQTVRRGRSRLAQVAVALFIGALAFGLQGRALCDIFLYSVSGPVDVTPEVASIDGRLWVMSDSPFEITVDFVHGHVYDMNDIEIGYVDDASDNGGGLPPPGP